MFAGGWGEGEGEWEVARSVREIEDEGLSVSGIEARVRAGYEWGRSIGRGGAHGACEGSVGVWTIRRV